MVTNAGFPLKPTGRSFKRNEIGLRVPLREYGAFVVRFLSLLWGLLLYLYFFISFLMSRACLYTCFFSLSSFQSRSFSSFFFLSGVFTVFSVMYIHRASLPGLHSSCEHIFFFKKYRSAVWNFLFRVATWLV